MKIQVFSVFDSKSKVFGQPNFILNVPTAMRIWPEAAGDKSTAIGRYPADHTLFHIGEWCDETGTLTSLEHKINLGTALEVQKPEQVEGNA